MSVETIQATRAMVAVVGTLMAAPCACVCASCALLLIRLQSDLADFQSGLDPAFIQVRSEFDPTSIRPYSGPIRANPTYGEVFFVRRENQTVKAWIKGVR